MKRKQRTEILISRPPALMKSLADEIVNKYGASIIEEPNPGLVMVKVRETAKQSLFYLGEVLVTECKVKVGESIGIGLVRGEESDAAYHLAVIDAAYSAELEETAHWEALLQKEQQMLVEERAEKRRKLLVTKVDFDTMDQD